MPTPNEHLSQARHNERLANQLVNENPPRFLDWVLTVAFYSALHYVKYLRACCGLLVGTSHDDVDQYFTMPELRALHRCYRGMKDDSRDARYNCLMPTPVDAEDCLQNRLVQIREHILQLHPPVP